MRDVTDFDAQKMHMQMHGRANFRDVIRYREMLRRRKIFIILDFIALISLIVGYLFYKSGFYTNSYTAFGVAGLIIFYFIFRKISRKNRNNRRNFRRHHKRSRRRR